MDQRAVSGLCEEAPVSVCVQDDVSDLCDSAVLRLGKIEEIGHGLVVLQIPDCGVFLCEENEVVTGTE